MNLQKIPRYLNPKLLKLADGAACSACGMQDGTVVAAHSNASIHGKCKGMKSHDLFVAFLCHSCHTWLDSGTDWYRHAYGSDYDATREGKLEFFRRAHEATMLYLWREGKVKCA